MSVLPTHPATAIRKYGHSGGPTPERTRIEAASKTNNRDEENSSSSQRHSDSGHAYDGSPAAGGVLRLLQEGHFKGVADVRLRLNFQQRLAEVQGDDTRSVFQQELAQVRDQFVSLADALVPAELQTDSVAAAFADALQAFEENAQQALADRGLDAPTSFAAVLSDLRAAFDTFSDSVENAFSTGSEDSDSGQSTTGTVSEPSFQLADFMARLSGIFSDTLTELASHTAAGELPDLSGPAGDGAAYDKFVAEYNRLKAAETDTADRVNIQA